MRIADHIWKRSVEKQIHHRRKEVIPAYSGCFHAALPAEEGKTYISVSGSVEGKNGLLPLLRELVAAGADPIGVSGVVYLPKTDSADSSVPEDRLRACMVALEKECSRFDLEIMQMDVRAQAPVTDLLLAVTLIGKADQNGFSSLKQCRPRPGQNIVMTGWTGLEEMKELLSEKRELLKNRFPDFYLRQAENLYAPVLPLRERELAKEAHVSMMQAVGEGGILDALWQLGERGRIGLTVSLGKIPIRQEIIEIAEVCGKNPYRMKTGGSLLMVIDSGEAIVDRYLSEGIPAAVIGEVAESMDRILCLQEERSFLTPYRPEKI